MILSFDQLALIEPRAKLLEEAPVIDANGAAIGWHSTVIGSHELPLGSGFHADQEMARRVAVAESIERALFRRISRDPTLSTEFLMKEFPSSCGFAAGFDFASTRRRAIAEAVERWAWSKWIDEGHFIPSGKVPLPSDQPLRDHLLMKFDSYQLFERRVSLQGGSHIPAELKWTVLVAFKDGGAFPGSRVCALDENATEHAAVEAWRHWRIYQGLRGVMPTDLVNGRIHHFGRNALTAREAMARPSRKDWPEPHLRLIRSMGVELGSGLKVHLSRALCSDYTGWHEGDASRFVY